MLHETTATRTRRMIVRLTTDAMLIALFTVFSAYLSISTPIAQISFASIPIILCAFLFGPVDALAVATVGTFFEQLLTFGIAPTTILWMLPTMLQALFVGCAAWMCRYRPKKWQSLIIVVVAELLLTATNTACLYLDGFIMSYPVKALHLILPTRLTAAGIRMVLTVPLSLFLLDPIRKVADAHGRITAARADKQAEA